MNRQINNQQPIKADGYVFVKVSDVWGASHSTGQLFTVVRCYHHTPRAAQTAAVASASEDDKSYWELLHRWSSLNRKPRPKTVQHSGCPCWGETEDWERRQKQSSILQKQAAEMSKTLGVYLENRVLGNCFQWTVVSNYAQTSARVPTIEAAYVVE